MTDLNIAFGILSAALVLVGYAIYFRSIYIGKTKPHMFSFIVWGTTVGIVFVAQILEGAGPGAWVTGISTLGALSIAIIGLRQKAISITNSDKASFVAAFVIIVIWILTKNALIAVVLATIIDILGFWPTFRKTYLLPYSENITAYAINGVSLLISVFAIANLNLATVLYPLTFIILNMAFVSMTVIRRYVVQKQSV